MHPWSAGPASRQTTTSSRFAFTGHVTGCLVALALLAALFLPLAPGRVLAADQWQTASTDALTVMMEPNERLAVSSFLDAYGHFAETAIDEISLVLDIESAGRPILLQVFAQEQLYDDAIAALPRANESDDVLAFADAEHATVLIPLSRFIALPTQDAENQLRHAIAHILIGQASGFNIPAGFDEGFARYVERVRQPTLARYASIVQSAYRDSSLASWSNMNRTVPLDDQELVEAQAYASVGYLLQSYGLDSFQNFVAELQTAASWRDAMNLAYAPFDSDDLERQWRDDIPLWAQGDWKWNLVAGFDLQPARDLLARGNFEGASNALLVSEQLLSEINDPAWAAEVTELKDLARIGSLAEAKMKETQQALENFAYDRAFAAIEQAADQYNQLPADLRPTDLIAQYREMAITGIGAMEQLEIARIQAGAWSDYPDARAAAIDSASGFAALGDAEGHQDARMLVSQMDATQRQLVLLLATLALLTLVWLVLWLLYRPSPVLRWDGED
jgi:hypothetical protein